MECQKITLNESRVEPIKESREKIPTEFKKKKNGEIFESFAGTKGW